jgi:hypothetical protein
MYMMKRLGRYGTAGKNHRKQRYGTRWLRLDEKETLRAAGDEQWS